MTRPIDSERREGEGAGLKSWREGKGRVRPLANQLPEETKAHRAVVIDQKGGPRSRAAAEPPLFLFLRFETVHARDRRTPFIRTPNELEHHPNRSTAVPTGRPDDVSQLIEFL